MKKILLVVFVSLSSMVFAQAEFPYSKILRMSDDELKEAKFKYDSYRNQYVLNKSNGLQGALNVLSAINGTTADIKPHEDDYQITLQYGDDGVSSLTVIFYKDDTYHELVTFIADNGENLLETNSNTINKIQFNYDGLSFELNMRVVGITATTGLTNSALVKTRDESYNVYTYSIFTGIEPQSEFIQSEVKKQEKRDKRGAKKRTASELM